MDAHTIEVIGHSIPVIGGLVGVVAVVAYWLFIRKYMGD